MATTQKKGLFFLVQRCYKKVTLQFLQARGESDVESVMGVKERMIVGNVNFV